MKIILFPRYLIIAFLGLYLVEGCSDNPTDSGILVTPKPLLVGMEWIDSLDMDSTRHAIDSGEIHIDIINARISRLNTITDSALLKGEYYLNLHSTDTVFITNNPTTIRQGNLYVRYTDSAEYLLLPVNFSLPFTPLVYSDTLVLKALALPLASGSSWDIAAWNIDTIVPVLGGLDTMRVIADLHSTGSVVGDSTVIFGGNSYLCSKVQIYTDVDFIILDRNVVEYIDTIPGADTTQPDTTVTRSVVVWDTAQVGNDHSTSSQFYTSEFSVSLYSHEEQQKKSRNLNRDLEVTETITKRSWLKSYLYPEVIQ
jgi:hypothetical protein